MGRISVKAVKRLVMLVDSLVTIIGLRFDNFFPEQLDTTQEEIDEYIRQLGER